MKIRGWLLLALLFISTPILRADWYGDKYSLFVHYGLYSIPGGVWNDKPVTRGYSEQILTFGIGFSDWYEAYTSVFDASAFDAEAIVQLAKKGGMRSVVMTAKHHDGFCLWRTKSTDYNVYDATPAQRDLVAELAEACRRNGIGFGIYFSLIDWHYPYAMPYSSHNADPVTPLHHEYNKEQVRELLTQYGTVDELWFDMASLQPEQSKELYELVHDLQPSCQVSGRVGNDYADFAVMADNEYPDYAMEIPWQTAASMFDETWGYRSWQERGSVMEKAKEKFTSLVKVVSGGGKYLLNIGPKGDGSIVPFEAEVITQIGAMITPISEALYGTHKSPFPYSKDLTEATLSENGKELYLFIPTDSEAVYIPHIKERYASIRLLNDSRKVVAKSSASKGLQLRFQGLSRTIAESPYTVVKISFKRPFRMEQPKVQEPVFTPYNAECLYAHSAIDYYTGYKSIIGYRWRGERPFQKLQCYYTDGEINHHLEVNGQPFHLSPSWARAEQKEVNLEQVEWQRLESARRGGRFGVHAPSLIDKEDYNPSDWEEQPLLFERKSTAKAEYLRYTVEAKDDIDLPLQIAYSEGMMLFLDGHYVAGEIARPKEAQTLHKQLIVLPLAKGKHVLTIKTYRRWGRYGMVSITPQRSYTLYTQEIVLNTPSPQLYLRERAFPTEKKHFSASPNSPKGAVPYPKARSIALYNILFKPLR